MTPYYADDWLTVYAGDCRAVLPTLAAESVDCIVTSPPYWGLRDYGTEGQLGLEPTPELYVANLVAVFGELRRVLKPSGTCWLNLGDSYIGGGRGGANGDQVGVGTISGNAHKGGTRWGPPTGKVEGLASKQLVGIPWRVAFALQANGWYLRSDIIWSKPNPMPESVTDRPTKAHEYLFLLTKSARYFYDADAVREEFSENTIDMRPSPEKVESWRKVAAENGMSAARMGLHDGRSAMEKRNPAGRNLRSVWTIATRPYPGAHFAVFPPELPERCIKAGSSERGVCPECGAPWERVTERVSTGKSYAVGKSNTKRDGGLATAFSGYDDGSSAPEFRTIGWQPSCRHETLKSQPAVILDPFAGSGTVGLVANRLSRRAILIDLNPDYISQQMQRNAQTPLGLPA